MEKNNEYHVEMILYDFDSFTEFMKIVNKFRVMQRKKEFSLLMKTPIALEYKRIGYSDKQIFEKIKSMYYTNESIGENNIEMLNSSINRDNT